MNPSDKIPSERLFSLWDEHIARLAEKAGMSLAQAADEWKSATCLLRDDLSIVIEREARAAAVSEQLKKERDEARARLAHAVEVQRLRRARLHERLVGADETIKALRAEVRRANTLKTVAKRMLSMKRELTVKAERERGEAVREGYTLMRERDEALESVAATRKALERHACACEYCALCKLARDIKLALGNGDGS